MSATAVSIVVGVASLVIVALTWRVPITRHSVLTLAVMVNVTDSGVRFGAWMALSNYGDKARARLPELEAAAELEKDQSVQKAIRDTLTRLKAAGR